MVLSDIIKNIEIIGNNRISDETIIMFSNISKNQNINNIDLNTILINLYQTDFFKDVKVKLTDNILQINVIENPIIYNIKFKGLKSKSLTKVISTLKMVKESQTTGLKTKKIWENVNGL